MTRAMLLGSAVLVVLAPGGGAPCWGDPPVVIGPGAATSLRIPQASEVGSDPVPLARLADYWNSECLRGWPCGEDEIELTVEGDTLHVLHSNATYNCCPDEIVISFSMEKDLLLFTEEEILTIPCDCVCCYDVGATVVDLPPGTYTVEFCWFDYETGEITCFIDEIVIPGGGGSPRSDPPLVVVDPEAVRRSGQSPASEAPAEPLQPRIESYSNSGCLNDSGRDVGPCEEDDQIEFTVEEQTLHVLHSNATYNCCLDDIAISVSQEGDLLSLTEEEILTLPCYCICCYNVEATVVDLAPGTYTVEFCWYDYETHQIQCYVEEIVIPGGGGSPRGDPLLVVVDPEAVAESDQSPASEAPAEPRQPRIDDYSNSGCLNGSERDSGPCEEDDQIELTVEEQTLHVLHSNATYNCCLDDIVISVSQEGDLLSLTEEEILTLPCWCICCYNVEATVVDLAPGTYTVEFCWFDYETSEIQCYVEDIVIP